MMKFNFEKTLLVSALALASTTLMAGNPNDGGENRKVGDKVGAHGVIGCLTAKGGINNIVVRNVDSTSSGPGGVTWGPSIDVGSSGSPDIQFFPTSASNTVNGLPNSQGAVVINNLIEYSPPLKNKKLSRKGYIEALKKYRSLVKQHKVAPKLHVDYANELCRYLDEDGHQDWYAPSKEELKCLFNNKDAITQATGNAFEEYPYWSSSVLPFTFFFGSSFEGENYAWALDFSDSAEAMPIEKDEEFKVRCVRHYPVS